jgi:hypothetical protein
MGMKFWVIFMSENYRVHGNVPQPGESTLYLIFWVCKPHKPIRPNQYGLTYSYELCRPTGSGIPAAYCRIDADGADKESDTGSVFACEVIVRLDTDTRVLLQSPASAAAATENHNMQRCSKSLFSSISSLSNASPASLDGGWCRHWAGVRVTQSAQRCILYE